MFPRWNIHKYTWTSPAGNTHNQTDHILIHMRWHSNILDVRSFRGADCDIDHILLVVKIREREAVSKQEAQKMNGVKHLRKLNELFVRKQYQIEIKNTFAALENWSGGEDINRIWKNVKENFKTSAKDSLGLHEL